jgi:transcription initiation factor TFIIIB Brf1 subunit/transcription initiation factor TFIIB
MNIAIALADNVTKLDLASNHQPNSIAAACILLLVRHCNLGISKKDIIQEFKISEPTLNKTIERLDKWKTVLFNTDISSKISQIVDTTILDEDINTKLAELNISMTAKPVTPKPAKSKRKKIVDA